VCQGSALWLLSQAGPQGRALPTVLAEPGQDPSPRGASGEGRTV
jgi:hypothetical protein